jgi:hypothetical protein
MNASPTITAIAPAFVAAVGELAPVGKDATNPAFRNKYASLDAMMEQVRPTLARHGLAVLQSVTHPETDAGRVVGIAVETRVLHTSGEWIAGLVTLPVEKSTAQGTGSAISYGRRYGLSALLGLTAEDDDGQAASVPQKAAPARAAARPAAAPAAPAAEAGQRLYEAVPATPRRKTFTGDIAEALRTPYPFKKNPANHGKPLGECSMELLTSTAEWCRKTDEAKFADLIARMDAVVVWQIEQEQAEERTDDVSDITDDHLPF